jgi:hypothetical protein
MTEKPFKDEMTEQEFVIEAHAHGLTEKQIKSVIRLYNRLKASGYAADYEFMLDIVLKSQERKENIPKVWLCVSERTSLDD